MLLRSVKSLPIVILSFVLCYADVPQPKVHQPDIPYLNQPFLFQTLELEIFTPYVSGIVPDHYSDLNWNPAFLVRQKQKSFYFDLFRPGTVQTSTGQPVYDYNYASSDYAVIPSWYGSTSINTVETTPLYRLGILLPLTSRLNLAVINRSLFDYGPFRTSSYWYGGARWDNEAYTDISADLYEPQRLEVDNNQQTVWGTQTVVSLSYELQSNLDLGVRLGHYIFRREGTLYDSQWGFYPHSSFADLNDEELQIDGNNIDFGAGLLYHPSECTTLGFMGGYSIGNGHEKSVSQDSSSSWSERQTASKYYSIYDYNLDKNERYDSDSKRPYLSLQYEKSVSPQLKLRSFLYKSWKNTEIEAATAADDTTYSDRTYDTYHNSSYYFQRTESHSSRIQELDGSGEDHENELRGFVSLTYIPEDQWSIFGGIFLRKYKHSLDISENSFYRSHNFQEVSLYEAGTSENYYYQDKIYEYDYNYTAWTIIAPIGFKVQVVKGLKILLGTDLRLEIVDWDEGSRVLYGNIRDKVWHNGNVAADDIQTDRYEEYSSDPAKEFTRTTSVRFGAIYQHPCGVKLYIKSADDIFNLNNWAMGMEIAF